MEEKIHFGKIFQKFFSPEDIAKYEGGGQYTPEKAEWEFRERHLEGPLILPYVVYETVDGDWKKIPGRLTSYERKEYVRVAEKELSKKKEIRSWQIIWVAISY